MTKQNRVPSAIQPECHPSAEVGFAGFVRGDCVLVAMGGVVHHGSGNWASQNREGWSRCSLIALLLTAHRPLINVICPLRGLTIAESQA
jgi:hypothetical protein